MSRTARRLAILSLCAAGLLPVPAAQAQWYANGANRPPPLYPYELQPGQSYAVEVAPGTYVIHHPSDEHGYRAVSRRIRHPRQAARRYEAAPKPRRTHANRALIEGLRRRDARRTKRAAERAARLAAKRAAKRAKRATHHAGKQADRYANRKPDKIIRTKRIVREKPVVIETRRVVQGPPKVVTRRHYVDDVPAPARGRRHIASAAPRPPGDEYPRVIHADAEVTIFGPDRMSIRLVRKDGRRLDGSARAGKAK